MTLHVDLLNETKKIYSGESTKVVLPTTKGIMEVLPHHVGFVVNLVPGKIVVYNQTKKVSSFDGGIGVSYKNGETVTILVEEPVQ